MTTDPLREPQRVFSFTTMNKKIYQLYTFLVFVLFPLFVTAQPGGPVTYYTKVRVVNPADVQQTFFIGLYSTETGEYSSDALSATIAGGDFYEFTLSIFSQDEPPGY